MTERNQVDPIDTLMRKLPLEAIDSASAISHEQPECEASTRLAWQTLRRLRPLPHVRLRTGSELQQLTQLDRLDCAQQESIGPAGKQIMEQLGNFLPSTSLSFNDRIDQLVCRVTTSVVATGHDRMGITVQLLEAESPVSGCRVQLFREHVLVATDVTDERGGCTFSLRDGSDYEIDPGGQLHRIGLRWETGHWSMTDLMRGVLCLSALGYLQEAWRVLGLLKGKLDLPLARRLDGFMLLARNLLLSGGLPLAAQPVRAGQASAEDIGSIWQTRPRLQPQVDADSTLGVLQELYLDYNEQPDTELIRRFQAWRDERFGPEAGTQALSQRQQGLLQVALNLAESLDKPRSMS